MFIWKFYLIYLFRALSNKYSNNLSNSTKNGLREHVEPKSICVGKEFDNMRAHFQGTCWFLARTSKNISQMFIPAANATTRRCFWLSALFLTYCTQLPHHQHCTETIVTDMCANLFRGLVVVARRHCRHDRWLTFNLRLPDCFTSDTI